MAVRRFLNFLLYSNIFIAIAAVALVFTNQITVGEEPTLNAVTAFVFFATLMAYSALKFRGSQNTVYTTTHHDWAGDNPRVLLTVLVIGGLGSVVYFFHLQLRAQIIIIILAFITALYGLISLPFTGGKKLRNFGVLKTLFVGIVWSVTTVVIPLTEHPPAASVLAFLLVRRFLFIAGLTLAFEVKDLAADEAADILTIPMLIGVKGTKIVAQLMLLVLAFITTAQYLTGEIGCSNMLAVNLSLLLSIICIQPVKKDTGDWWYYFVLDGMMILQFLLVYLAHIWFT